jgi:non-heme chloroperoxidase
MGATAGNDDGVPITVGDGVREAVMDNRLQLFLDFAAPYFGLSEGNDAESQGWRMAFWQQGMSGSLQAQYASIAQFWGTDFREELNTIDLPTLVVHGDADHIVPTETTGKRTAQIMQNAVLMLYPGASHGFPVTHQHQLNDDLAAFARD